MRVRREDIEWVRFNSVDTEKHDLPRVLLIGDSITEGYYQAVKERLKGEFCVDYLALAYSVDMPIFHRLIMTFVRENRYDVIHFNHGHHCGHMKTLDLYREKTVELLKRIGTERIVLANCTVLYEPRSMEPDHNWITLLPQMNETIAGIADELSVPLNDLYTVSAGIGPEGIREDGGHFTPIGYAVVADKVASTLRDFIAKKNGTETR